MQLSDIVYIYVSCGLQCVYFNRVLNSSISTIERKKNKIM